jgi:hypothetical protein
MWPPGYDNKGNLYAEAGTSGFLCELPAGGTSLAPVAFDHTINSPGGVMWDGKYLTLTDEAYKGGISTALYRVKQTRGGLRVVSKTRIRDRQCGATVAQPFIVGNKNTPANHQEGTAVVGANPACYYFSSVNYWHYPRGGSVQSGTAPARACRRPVRQHQDISREQRVLAIVRIGLRRVADSRYQIEVAATVIVIRPALAVPRGNRLQGSASDFFRKRLTSPAFDVALECNTWVHQRLLGVHSPVIRSQILASAGTSETERQ